jgi:hypothetical protein
MKLLYLDDQLFLRMIDWFGKGREKKMEEEE